MATESTNNSAAAMAQSSSPMKIENISIPMFGGGNNSNNSDIKKYKVRYLKVDFDDMASVVDLEILETKGLAATDIVVLNKAAWTFMDKYLMLITYLELITPN